MQSVILALVYGWAEAWLKAEGAELERWERGDYTLQDSLIDLEGRLFNWCRMLQKGMPASLQIKLGQRECVK